MERAIVTGATSMLGVALIEECVENNIPVVAIVRPLSKKLDRLPKSSLIKVIECEISEYSNLSDIIELGKGVFYHFAWNLANRKRNDDLVGQSKNIEYTLNVLDSASKIGCDLFIGAGSQAEYGEIKAKIIKCDTPTNPNTPYGISKYAAGKLAMIQSKRLGIECIWTRVFSVYGDNDHKDSMISTTLQKIYNKEPTEFSEGNQLWDYLHSKDAGRAYYLIGKKGISNSIYPIASGECHPLCEYINAIERTTKPKYEMGLGKIDSSSLIVKNLCVDIQSLVKDTGFKPTISFDMGIEKLWREITK